MNPKYIMPAQDRARDHQYHDALNHIFQVFGQEDFYFKNPYQEFGTYSVQTVPPMYFELQNGFPIITERKIGFWKKPIAEILAFMHGARTAEELKAWGCGWWDSWCTDENAQRFGLAKNDLGPGSYGGGFVRNGFNQFEHLIKQIKDMPSLRTHIIDPWIPEYCLQHNELKRKVIVAPCHGWIHVTILNGKLTLRMNQRSADFVVGVPSNIIQYAALTIMIAHVTGYEPYMYIHAPQDSQIYENHKEYVVEMLSRRQTIFPTLNLTEEGLRVNNLFDFRPDHFELSDYHPHPAISNIPVTL